MAKERLKSPRARLFVALDLPEALRQGLGAWGRRGARRPGPAAGAAESLHITLAFLGYRPEKEIERIGEIVAECVAPAPLIELQDPAPRPRGDEPRLFALPRSRRAP